jgi:hypothetical protein
MTYDIQHVHTYMHRAYNVQTVAVQGMLDFDFIHTYTHTLIHKYNNTYIH